MSSQRTRILLIVLTALTILAASLYSRQTEISLPGCPKLFLVLSGQLDSAIVQIRRQEQLLSSRQLCSLCRLPNSNTCPLSRHSQLFLATQGTMPFTHVAILAELKRWHAHLPQLSFKVISLGHNQQTLGNFITLCDSPCHIARQWSAEGSQRAPGGQCRDGSGSCAQPLQWRCQRWNHSLPER